MGMQATSKGNMPVVLLKEGGSETKGKDAQKNNIAAAKIVAEIVHTSLGSRRWNNFSCCFSWRITRTC